MRVVISPDSFKGSLDASAAAQAIAAGVRAARADCDVTLAPMADGGEGTLDILVNAASGQRRRVQTTGPLGEPVEAVVGLIDEAGTAIVEFACAAGYQLVPPDRRDPLGTTTYGLGRVIRAAIESGVENIVLGLGGSATVDGGAGMMQALGLRFSDRDGRPFTHIDKDSGAIVPRPITGGELGRIDKVAWHDPPENLEHVHFTIAHDVLSPACGPTGAAAVFAPQKGASPKAVEILDQGLSHWADVLERLAGRSLRDEPGTGAAGGVALPMLALLDAGLVPGVDLVMEAIGLVDRIVGAALVITGEGRLDRQSLMGKVVGAVGRACRAAHVPCVAIVGTTGEGADDCLTVLDDYTALNCPLDQTAQRLAEVAAQIANEWLP